MTTDAPFIAGSRAFVRRKGQNRWFDLGNIQPIGVDNQVTTVQRYGSWGGTRQEIGRKTTELSQSYTITGDSFNLDNLSLIFMSGDPVVYENTTTSITDVKHAATPDGLVKVKDSDGKWLFNLTAVSSVKKDNAGSAGTALVKGTDWDVYDLKAGFILLKDTVDVTADVYISATAPAIASGKRQLRPLSASQTIEADVMLMWSSDNFGRLLVREFTANLTPQSPSISDTEFSTWSVTASVVSNLTDTVPAGTLTQVIGALPLY